ncbi:MAG: hypothetical protein U0R72_11500 [Nakamurella multipartita]
MASSSVRPATVDDGRVIADLQLSVWRQAYATVLPAAALTLDPAEHAAAWTERIARGGPVLLAVEGAEPVGFAALSSTFVRRTCWEPLGEIEVLHVEPRWGRRGHGEGDCWSPPARNCAGAAPIGRWWIPQVDAATTRFVTAAGWAEDGVRRELDTGGPPIIGCGGQARWTWSRSDPRRTP